MVALITLGPLLVSLAARGATALASSPAGELWALVPAAAMLVPALLFVVLLADGPAAPGARLRDATDRDVSFNPPPAPAPARSPRP
jgi:hypothetical protein